VQVTSGVVPASDVDVYKVVHVGCTVRTDVDSLFAKPVTVGVNAGDWSPYVTAGDGALTVSCFLPIVTTPDVYEKE
jgi:hypothetical protein